VVAVGASDDVVVERAAARPAGPTRGGRRRWRVEILGVLPRTKAGKAEMRDGRNGNFIVGGDVLRVEKIGGGGGGGGN
jgi:hypothetical protein